MEPWKLYHLKIALGDVGDAIFDSGVFLEENSFSSFKDTTIDGFKDYPDRYHEIDWDEIFGIKKTEPILNTIKKDTLPVRLEYVNIYFDINSDRLTDSAFIELNKIIDYLKTQKDNKLRLYAYTDNTGTKKHNKNLSSKRASKIIKYLIDVGLNKSPMTYLGISSVNETMDNSNDYVKSLNRRIEILINDEEK